MANPQKTESKLMVWIGLGLWLVIGLAVLIAVIMFVCNLFNWNGWHIPPLNALVILGIIVFLFFEYRFRVTAAAVLEVLAEVEKTNARIELLENSVRDKLGD